MVDNGSSDGTAAVAAASAAGLDGLAVRIVTETRPGRAAAKNKGARVARGDLLLFMDADSRMAPDLLAAVRARWSAGERAASIRVVADSSDPLDRGFFALMELGKTRFGIRAQMAWCARDLFGRVGGFDERMWIGEDRDLLVRVARARVAVGHLTESRIYTSPRRLRTLPLRLAVLTTFARWALAHAGIGREWRY